jgi:hypothetical protein
MATNIKKVLLQVLIFIFVSLIIFLVCKNIQNKNKEPFIGHLYRPHIRKINTIYENFMNNYGPDRIMNKFKKIINY